MVFVHTSSDVVAALKLSRRADARRISTLFPTLAGSSDRHRAQFVTPNPDTPPSRVAAEIANVFLPFHSLPPHRINPQDIVRLREISLADGSGEHPSEI